MSQISRRNLLHGAAAAAPIIALAGTGSALPPLPTGTPDPVFAAIEAHRAVNAAFPESDDDEAAHEEWNEAFWDASWDLLETTAPTTLPGWAALTSYIAEHRRAGHEWPERKLRRGEKLGEGSFDNDALKLLASFLNGIVAEGRAS